MTAWFDYVCNSSIAVLVAEPGACNALSLSLDRFAPTLAQYFRTRMLKCVRD